MLHILAAGCLFVVGCDTQNISESAQQQPQTAANAVPESIATVVAEDLPYDYLRIRKAVAAKLKDRLNSAVQPDERHHQGFVDLYDCGYQGPIIATDSSPVRAQMLDEMAQRVTGWRNSLVYYQYDQRIFSTEIGAFERRMIAGIDRLPPDDSTEEWTESGYHKLQSDEITRTAEAMEVRRLKLNPDKMAIVSEGGCGEGEVSTVVRLVPRGAQAWLIREFPFRNCQKLMRDPWDTEKCRQWEPVSDGDLGYYSGNYRYLARWRGGRETRGETFVQPGMSDDDPVIVTVKSPQ